MGINVNDVFSSKYLKAADLQKRSVLVTIASAEVEMMDGKPKIIVFFRGKEKGMTVNKTNSNAIAYMYGPDTDGWIGKQIEIYPTMVDFQGKMTEAIRIRPPSVGSRQPQQTAPVTHPPVASHPNAPGNDSDNGAAFDDEIPF